MASSGNDNINKVPPTPPSNNPILPWDFNNTNRPITGTPVASAQSEQKPAPAPPALFRPLTIRGLTFANRFVVSPMCMYSSKDGLYNSFHLAHLAQFAFGGSNIIFTEATAVVPSGRISPYCAGIWSDEHIPGFYNTVQTLHGLGSYAGIQLAHAGRKASTLPTFLNDIVPKVQTPGAMFTSPGTKIPDEVGGWNNEVVGPSALSWDDDWVIPAELTKQQILDIVQAFVQAAIRADKAGFDIIEIHGAHGYLINSFLSPASNKRTDEYGGSTENRARMLVEILRGVRAVWPSNKAIFLRLSCEEWIGSEGLQVDEIIKILEIIKNSALEVPDSKEKNELIDLVDCSSGGNNSKQHIPAAPGFQVTFANKIRKHFNNKLLTGAVGLITEASQANEIVEKGEADFIFLARELLRNPRFPLNSAKQLGWNVHWLPQYARAKI